MSDTGAMMIARGELSRKLACRVERGEENPLVFNFLSAMGVDSLVCRAFDGRSDGSCAEVQPAVSRVRASSGHRPIRENVLPAD